MRRHLILITAAVLLLMVAAPVSAGVQEPNGCNNQSGPQKPQANGCQPPGGGPPGGVWVRASGAGACYGGGPIFEWNVYAVGPELDWTLVGFSTNLDCGGGYYYMTITLGNGTPVYIRIPRVSHAVVDETDLAAVGLAGRKPQSVGFGASSLEPIGFQFDYELVGDVLVPIG